MPSRKKNNRSIYILLLLFTITFLIVISVGWWLIGNIAVNTSDTQTRVFIIEKGTSLRGIARNLVNAGLIRDANIFLLQVKIMGVENNIQAGTFQLSPAMNVGNIAKALTIGTNDIRITIPEGKRAEEVAEILKQSMLLFDTSWTKKLQDNEGYLFPDTYNFAQNSSIETIVAIMKDNFEKKYASLPTINKLSKKEIVTLASLIEREAKHAEDRPLVSSVMHNRLNINMALQVDATIQYAIGYDYSEHTWWKKGLTINDLQINSLYNTYNHQSLPPEPICNPGLAALQAAVEPANTNYFYYISDKQGINHYAVTLEEHNNNIKRYGL